MGLRGPPKKPTELKLLEGTPGGRHKLTPNEPRPEKLSGSRPPKQLSKEAKAVWRILAPKLETLGLLTTIDQNALLRYCDAFIRWLQAKDFLDKNGFQYEIFCEQTPEDIKEGKAPKIKYMAQYPHVSIYMQLTKELTRLEQQFGMTPAARSSINVKIPEDSKSSKARLNGAW